jgi:hypothetical protein
MFKKLSLLLAAVAVLAFAVPAMASAHKVTSSKNVLAATGSIITGTGSNVILNSSVLGAIKCSSLTLNGELTKNDGTTVEGSGTTNNPSAVDCTNGTRTVKVTSVAISKLTAASAGTWASFVATIDIEKPTETLECTFTGKEVPFTYTSGAGNTINFANVSGAGITGTTGCGTAKLEATFAFEIGSTAVILD